MSRAGVIGVCLGAALVLPSPAHAARALGLNVHQSSTIGPDVAKACGTKWLRIDLNWLNVEPTQGQFDFSVIDPIVDAAEARGQSILAVVGYGPAWASSGDTMSDGANNDVPIDGAYADFVTAVVNHYAGRIDHYELWNEPNLGQFFEGSVNDYVQKVLVPGANAVHAACPSCKTVGPGIATVGAAYDAFFDAVLTAASGQIDILSGHAYATFPDVDSGAGMSKDSFLQKLESHRVLKTPDGTVIYEGWLSFREVMEKHGAKQPFWLTETGYEAKLGDAAAEAKQTLHYRHVLEAMLTRPWWQATIFYEAFDEPPQQYTWGVCLHDDTAPMGWQPKPVMSLLAKASASQTFGGTATSCDDGLDDDGDGLVDYPMDPDCTSPSSASELGPSDVGGGGSAGAAGSGTASAGKGGASGAPGAGGGASGAAGASGGAAQAGGGGAIGDAPSVPAPEPSTGGGCSFEREPEGGIWALFAAALAASRARRRVSK